MQKIMPYFVEVKETQIGQRIDNFLITHLKGVPKSRVYRLLRKGEVRVNKKRAKPDYRLQANDIVRIPPVRTTNPNENAKQEPPKSVQLILANRVLFEDDNFLIINKPAGVAVHGGSGLSFGVIEAMRHMRPKAKFLELAHRLDRDTSGCLLLAKKPAALKAVHTMLREGTVTKTYLALVRGHWPKAMHTIDAPLKKFELQGGERMVKVTPEGKSAQTDFRVIQRFENATLVEAKPLTGRTHQIRVHALHAGHPLAGDDKYGDKTFNKQMRTLGCTRLFLHAKALEFVFENEKITAHAELDEDMENCLKQLK